MLPQDRGSVIVLKSSVLAWRLWRHLGGRPKEERVTPFRIVVPVAEPALLNAYAAAHPATLELTLTVRDDS